MISAELPRHSVPGRENDRTPCPGALGSGTDLDMLARRGLWKSKCRAAPANAPRCVRLRKKPLSSTEMEIVFKRRSVVIISG